MKPAFAIVVMIAARLFAGCGGGKVAGAENDQGLGEDAPYALEYTDVMEFTRGVERSYRVAGKFASGEEAALTIDGLPAGAHFEKETLTWLPACDLTPEAGYFMRGYMNYRLRINLAGRASDSLVQKPAIVIVHMTGEGSTCAK